MDASIATKLGKLAERHQQLNGLLADPEVIGDQNRFRDLSKEYAEIAPLVGLYQNYCALGEEMQAAETMLKDPDEEIRRMAHDEVARIGQQSKTLESDLLAALLPKDPNDTRNVFLEIRAGTGGDEAAIFAGDLFRMYNYYAESNRWSVESVSHSAGEHGGYKEIIARIAGKGAYSRLKFESGVHRVQRVPETEAQGRIHTSTCTVAILAEADEIDAIDISTSDLKIDTFRASGAGGQHVNKTDSAIRITHLPSGIAVECQDERSQHKNRARAMSILNARLLEIERHKQREEEAATRKSLVGGGDRSERIRTYNFPQGRMTDHRINLTLYKLDQIMLGKLDDLIDALATADQADQLAALSA